MKKIVILLCFCLFVHCIRDKNPTAFTLKYFDPDKLEQLDLTNLPGFWTPDSSIEKIDSDYATSVGKEDMLKCVRYQAYDKSVGVSVYTSQCAAIYGVESIIDYVACIIERDTTQTEDLYWYSDCGPDAVFTNKWNTIIEVKYYYSDFEEIKDLLYDTAAEIAQRIDTLSD